MPNRVLRDWTTSTRMRQVSVHAERFFTRLIMKADDYGLYTANPILLKAALFPYLINEVREADITRWMAECQKAGMILLYEIDSEDYLQIIDFDQVLRIKKPKYPPPPNSDAKQTTNTCEADVQHMTSTCSTDASLKRKETKQKRNEVETNASAPHQLFLNRFFGKEEEYTRTGITTLLQVPEIKLRWGETFNNHLLSQQRNHVLYNEWCKHFRSWLPKALKELKEADDAEAQHKARRYIN